MPDPITDVFSNPLGEKIESSEQAVNPAAQNYMLREDGFRMLREDNGFIVREG